MNVILSSPGTGVAFSVQMAVYSSWAAAAFAGVWPCTATKVMGVAQEIIKVTCVGNVFPSYALGLSTISLISWGVAYFYAARVLQEDLGAPAYGKALLPISSMLTLSSTMASCFIYVLRGCVIWTNESNEIANFRCFPVNRSISPFLLINIAIAATSALLGCYSYRRAYASGEEENES